MTIERPRDSVGPEIARWVRGVVTLPGVGVDWRALPRGLGQPVLVIPGFMTGDWSTLCLRRFLRLLDYRVYGWGLGQNHGGLRKLLPGVIARIDAIAERRGAPLLLIGWSLGGVLAREAARARPDRVTRIITLGTPIIGGPKFTAAAVQYERRGIDVDRLAASAAKRNAAPLPVPVTAIYSKNDGVVAWRACFDPNPANVVEYVEVDTGHAEMGFSADVYRILASELARASNQSRGRER